MSISSAFLRFIQPKRPPARRTSLRLHSTLLLIASACIAALLGGGCASIPPRAPREFRAAWVATVANIDWPSRPGLPAAQQQAEAIAILDRAHALKLNAIILQVRPAADALYASTLEPWSEYLTGEQGRAPHPLYDPLQLWVSEAHRRGLELHAWFNPYRARHPTAKSPLAASHLAKANPAVVKVYGDLLWMDPGEPAASQRTLDVIREVVRNYDIDGVHLDDYFYPYPIAAPLPPAAVPPNAASPTNTPGFTAQPASRAAAAQPASPVPVVAAPAAKPAPAPELDFPDEPSWQRYVSAGGRLARAEWRRQNVDRLVEQIYREVHAIKPWVRFGISPFGIGRPDRRPRGIEGFSQYDKLYADAERWLQRGWVDYFSPQLYWPIEQKPQDFAVLLRYWSRQNRLHRHLWPGLFTSKIDDTPKSWEPSQITRQVELVHQRAGANGHIHFSMVALQQDRKGIGGLLAEGPYAQPALAPATPWLGAVPPGKPRLHRLAPTDLAAPITIVPGAGKPAIAYAVWKRYARRWRFSVQVASELTIPVAPDASGAAVEILVVSAVDRLGNESPRVTLRLRTRATP